ncbi:uncharacterized protein LOC127798770 [Diospyros lotus]|uniref:uncharacterized protein LOC127798770 n=1 Tax=Diospyros lotus TaxID=55363 RepID=UPI002256D0DD|nr:uncharacterized protein LOC127798770 [Diospyros lotus]
MIRNNKETHPSLPPNYLTLAQLRERWLKEKQQGKQEEEEEVKATEQRENEDKERQKREDQENRYENGETSQEPSKTVPRRRPFRPNRGGKRLIAVGVKEQESVESRIVEVAVNDSERKRDGSKKKKLWMKMKARPEKGGTGGTEQPLPGEVPKGESAEAVVKGDVEKVMKGTEIKRNGGDMRVHGSNWEEEATVGGSDEIGGKLEVLSLGGERRGDRRSAGNVYRDHFKHNRGSAGFNLSKIQKPRDSKLVWVRKGEPSDVNLAQSS